MWIKICGTTSVEDARLAIDAGADALGFIFAPSRRRVTPEQVAAITPLLPDAVERIGVFTAGEPTEIAAAALLARLTGVQLHAAFAPEFYARLEAAAEGRLAILRTVHWAVSVTEAAGKSPPTTMRLKTSSSDAARADLWSAGETLRSIRASAPEGRVLLDSRVDGALGGTGVSFPWKAAANSLADDRGSLRLIVAGGLRPENVAEAIRTLAPYGVDVASGVEAQPGKKDPKQLHKFIENVRSASRDLS